MAAVMDKDEVCVLSNGKTNDLAQIYDYEPVVISDLPRTIEGHVNYMAIEALKDGKIMAGKYQSKMKVCAPPHVVILANFEPNRAAVSLDRWDVRYIGKSDNVTTINIPGVQLVEQYKQEHPVVNSDDEDEDVALTASCEAAENVYDMDTDVDEESMDDEPAPAAKPVEMMSLGRGIALGDETPGSY